MNEVTRHFCWHQNFVPWGLSAPALGLYTYIKSWKKKKSIQSDFKEIFLKLATNYQSDKMFLLTSKFHPQGVVSSCPGATCIYMYKIMKKKNCIKSDFKEIFLKLVANDGSDKRFPLTSKFCPLVVSAPDLQLYTFIKSWKDVYKVRDWRDSFKLATNGHSDKAFLLISKFWPEWVVCPYLGLCLNFFSSITADLNISSALRWAIQDQWSSGFHVLDKHSYQNMNRTDFENISCEICLNFAGINIVRQESISFDISCT